MFTDIVGYTALTESDEHLALELLEEHRKIVRPLISLHKGREVKTMGDAFLVEFTSALEAVRCAFEIQESLQKLNNSRVFKEKILLRVGIHLGDVVHSGGDVYGDAVNIASRLQGLSEAGGICVSRQVYESVRTKLRDFKFESLGTRELRNVENPIEVFKITKPVTGDSQSSSSEMPRNRVAVLPFVNISPDKSDEYFADGLTEELISRLSQAKDLRVIARTSAMNYKNKEKKIKEIGRELGAGTVVEGSVRKAGNKVRVTVQVVNASNEEHLWSSTYDRNLDDIFEIQSDIANIVASSFSTNLAPLTEGEKQLVSPRGEEKETGDVMSYTYFLRGRHLLRNENLDSVRQALEFFGKAIERDHSFARAYVGRAECYHYLADNSVLPFVEATKKAEAEAKEALKLNPDLPEAHNMLFRVYYTLDDFDQAEKEAKMAVELNPSDWDSYHGLGHIALVRGEISEAVRLFEISFRLDPLRDHNVEMLGLAYLYSGREAEALKIWNDNEYLFPQASYGGLFEYYMIKQDYPKAKEALERLRAFNVDDAQWLLGLEGRLAASQGNKEKAIEYARKIEDNSEKGTLAVNSIGFIYYALGDLDRFFVYMDRSAQNHSLPGTPLRYSPLYDKARKDPRYLKLMEKEHL
jgi:adenylate cyclase